MKKRFIAFLLVLTVIFSFALSIPSFAATSNGYINGTNVNIRADAGTNYASKGQVSNATVTVISSKKGADGYTWYQIKTSNGTEGYIRSDFIVISNPTPTVDQNFETQLLDFPDSYRPFLREIHKSYPKWKFIPEKVSISFDSAVDAQYSVDDFKKTKKNVELSYGEKWRDVRAYNYYNKTWTTTSESKWAYASRETIAYFMDPRNTLNSDNIFAYMQLSKDISQTTEILKALVKGTFLADGYNSDTDAYIKDIMKASEESGVSAYAIAAKIIVEQGVNGTSDIISGKYIGYEDCYNFFNIKAYGSNAITMGLDYAKTNNWNTRTISIVEGAKYFAGGYVKANQDTYYYMDFNVKNQDWNHQYATSVYDAFTKGKQLTKVASSLSGLELYFKIPIYTSIPNAISPQPVATLYPDVPITNDFFEAILYAKENRVFTGYANGYFGIADNIKREHFILALSRYSGEDISKYSTEKVNFKDVKTSQEFYSAIAWAYKNKITTGYENGKFGVGDNITREQMVQFFYNYAKYKGKSCTVSETANTYKAKYSDFSKVSTWATNSMVWALSSGLIKGRNSTTIAPKNNCIRAEAAQMFYNINNKALF